jgi:hypothetical protein
MGYFAEDNSTPTTNMANEKGDNSEFHLHVQLDFFSIEHDEYNFPYILKAASIFR